MFDAYIGRKTAGATSLEADSSGEPANPRDRCCFVGVILVHLRFPIAQTVRSTAGQAALAAPQPRRRQAMGDLEGSLEGADELLHLCTNLPARLTESAALQRELARCASLQLCIAAAVSPACACPGEFATWITLLHHAVDSATVCRQQPCKP